MTNGIFVYYFRFFLYSNHRTIWYLTWPVVCLKHCTCIQITHYLSYCVSYIYIYSVVNTLRGVKIPNSKCGDNNACAENIPWVYLLLYFVSMLLFFFCDHFFRILIRVIDDMTKNGYKRSL